MSNLNSMEHQRLAEADLGKAGWKNWGTYLSERAWGTVREDYSSDGTAWDYFSHDHARSRAYRWNEDGLGGFCNRYQNVCLAVALWNERDPILKERLFGLAGSQGNHGEDVKEYYYYLDATPTHSYMKMLYKYPQVEFPYARLIEENGQRGRNQPEYELIEALQDDFANNRYFDVFVEYAKADPDDILCRIRAVNRGSASAPIHILPHLWFRNNWSWGYAVQRPELKALDGHTILAQAPHLGDRWWSVECSPGIEGSPGLLFTENDTNLERLFGVPNPSPFVKDGIHLTVVERMLGKVNPEQKGTKAAAHFHATLKPGETLTVRVRFSNVQLVTPFMLFDSLIQTRQTEADEFYAAIQPVGLSQDEKLVQRQALAGLLWSKQFYHYNVQLWLEGDPGQPAPSETRRRGRNAKWEHLDNLDLLSVPDKWEYPWYAAWDLAFHVIPLALVDPQFAKDQLILLLREWYMHPNGQLPAYEWSFSDVNPPVHAWSAFRVYQMDKQITGKPDLPFLEEIFHKLLVNFTWWVNRKDAEGNNVFQGGFLGLDNIGVFDRSQPLPTGGHIEQADGTAWMALYCLNMLSISLELALTRPVYEEIATKFLEHFIYIANSFSDMGSPGLSLWDDTDGFFYDVLHTPDNRFIQLKVRSLVGLIPIFASTSLTPELLNQLPNFNRRLEWFLKYRPGLVKNIPSLHEGTVPGKYHLAIVGRDQLKRILERAFDLEEFLSEYGLRALSKYHAEHPYEFFVNGSAYRVHYEPAESGTGLFGGNSNWRGPIWFPMNYLFIEALREFNGEYGDTFKVEMPSGSGNWVTLEQAASDLCRRLTSIFLREQPLYKRRPVFGDQEIIQTDPHWRDYLFFYEYFNGDSGAGLGASHQTGWTALVAKIIQETGGTKKAPP